MILDYARMSRTETDEGIIATLLRKGWKERPLAPPITESQAVSWDGTRWVVRSLTAEELQQKADATADAQLKSSVRSALSAIKDGTGTNAERIARLEQAVYFLATRMVK